MERRSCKPSARFNFSVHAMYTMNDMLEGFMAYLEKNGLVRFDVRNEDDSHFC